MTLIKSIPTWLRRCFDQFEFLICPPPWRRGAVIQSLFPWLGIWVPLICFHAALVWGAGEDFGFPRLIWRTDTAPLESFLNGLFIALLTGFGTFLFFALDYSEWLADRRRMRRELKRQFDSDPKNGDLELNPDLLHVGRDHWTAALYRRFRERQKARGQKEAPATEKSRNPNEHADLLQDVVSYFFTYLFLAFALCWGILWLIQATLSDQSVNKIPGFFAGQTPRWYLVPLGFITGVGCVLLIHAANNWISSKCPPLENLGLAVADWVRRHDTGAQAAPRSPMGQRDPEVLVEGRLDLHAILAGIIVQIIRGFSLLVAELHFGNPHIAIPALCIWTGEFMLLYSIVFFVSRRRAWGFIAIGAVATWLLIPAFSDAPRYEFKSLAEPKPVTSDTTALDHSISPTDKSLGLFKGPQDTVVWPQDRPLVIVCASGGGITAEVWTVAMLSCLEGELKNFATSVRVITGASGGMVGAAAWVGHLSDHESKSKVLLDGTSKNQLSRVAQRMALWDFSIGLPFQRPPVRDLFGKTFKYTDRGNLLEDIWTSTGVLPELSKSFDELRSHELEGQIPSLIFAPMLAEDGTRLLISNLELSELRCTGKDGSTKPAREVQFDELGQVPLSTWARMGATFPLISPAAELPNFRDLNQKRRHAVDAGYYDVSGTNLAMGWLRECWLPWLLRTKSTPPSKIILIELDAYPRFKEVDEPSRYDVSGFFFEDAIRVLRGADSRRQSREFRNDEEIEAIDDFLNASQQLSALQEKLKGVELRTFRFTNPVKASLSWSLTRQEWKAITAWAKVITSAKPPEEVALDDDIRGVLGSVITAPAQDLDDPQEKELRSQFEASRELAKELRHLFPSSEISR